MADWEHDASITSDGKGEASSQLGLVRDDLVMEIGEQALGRMLAEKHLKVAKTIIESLRNKAQKGDEYKASMEQLSSKNQALNVAIENLRKETQRLGTIEKERDAARTQAQKLTEELNKEKEQKAALKTERDAEAQKTRAANESIKTLLEDLASERNTITELNQQVATLEEDLASQKSKPKSKKKTRKK